MLGEQRDLPQILEEHGRLLDQSNLKESDYDEYSEIEDRFINRDEMQTKRQTDQFRQNTQTYRNLDTAQ